MESRRFTARTSITSNLTTFQLPQRNHNPNLLNDMANTPSSTSNSTSTAVSGVMSPLATVSGDRIIHIVSSVESHNPTNSVGKPLYQQQINARSPQSTFDICSTTPSIRVAYAQQTYREQPQYTPSSSFQRRNSNSPTNGERTPAPSYNVNIPFPDSISVEDSAQQIRQPNIAGQPHQEWQQQRMHHGILSQQQQPFQNPPQGFPYGLDKYSSRPLPTLASYTPSSAPQQLIFPTYTLQTPTTQSPGLANPDSGPENRNPETLHQEDITSPSIDSKQQRPPSPSQNLPVLSSQVISNVHNSEPQIVPVGGMGMPYGPHRIGTFPDGPHPRQQIPQNDRPFKCDQCLHAFNRNHDLKRHKRLHLPVKPFPCNHCEKSYSRRDALKVCSLVNLNTNPCSVPSEVVSTS